MKQKQPIWNHFTLVGSDIARIQLMLESAKKQGVTISWIEYKQQSEISKDDTVCMTWGIDSIKTTVHAEYVTDDSEVTHYYEFKNGEDHILNNDSLVKLTQQFNKK